ncbi:MAG: ABC transporter permease [Mycobacteriales bacterium]
MSVDDFTPRAGPAGLPRMIRAQTLLEAKLALRNGEQVLLTLVIPTLLLVLFTTAPLVAMPHPRVAFLVPGVLGLAVMSTAFTGQAIAVGFERRYGVLKRLGATALPRAGLLAGKTLAVCLVECVQVGVVVGVGFALVWSPHGSPVAVVALLVLATVAFSGLGLLMAGTLRAEATLAAANLVYLVLLALGGVIFPVSRFPAGMRHVLDALPITALAGGLRAVLRAGGPVPGQDWLVLAGWAAAALMAAAATFRWE